ncbi:MAG: PEP-CTERM sorting domain-containing protein, partial [Myxococcota bacterium]
NSDFIVIDSGAELDVSESGLTLASGQMLGGSGRVIGDLTVASGSTLAPGNSPGTLSTGSQTWESGGALNIELDNATGVAGTNWDLLDISGVLSITATSGDPFQIALSTLLEGTNTPGDMSNFDASSTYIWTIATTTGGITGFSQDAFSIDDSGFTNSLVGDFSIPAFSLRVLENDLLLYYTPEPGTAVLLTMGLGSLGLRRRRTPVT